MTEKSVQLPAFLMHLWGPLRKVLQIGTHHLDMEHSRTILIINSLALVFTFAVWTKIPLALMWWPSTIWVVLHVLFTGLLALCTLILTHYSKNHLALAWLFIVATWHLASASILDGPEHNLMYFFLVILNVLFFATPLSRPWFLWGMTTCISLIYIGLIFWHQNYVPILNLPSSYIEISQLSNTLLLIGTSIVNAVYVRIRYLEVESQLHLEHQKTERILHNIFPHSVAKRLKDEDYQIADKHNDVTILFADIVNFTPFCERSTPEETVQLLDSIFTSMDYLVHTLGLEKVKTIGDAYMLVGGLPHQNTAFHNNSTEAVLQFALMIRDQLTQSFPGIQFRIGVDKGNVTTGVIGRKKFIFDVMGDCVVDAQNLENAAKPGSIWVGEKIVSELQKLKDIWTFKIADLAQSEVKAYELVSGPSIGIPTHFEQLPSV